MRSLWKWVAVIAGVAWLAIENGMAGGAAPPILNFQGRVLVEGVPFTGTGQFKFALIDATDSVVWTSAPDSSPADGVPDGAVAIAVSRGLYGAVLGEGMTALSRASFAAHDGLRLRVWFSDGAHGFQRLDPDQPLASVAYALRSASAEQADHASFATTAGTAATAQVAQGVAANPTFTGNAAFTGRVGIGTNLPGTELDVVGTVRSDRLVVRRTAVVAFGKDLAIGQEVPAGLDDVIAVAAGSEYSLALRATGTVVAWGAGDTGQTSVPAGLDQVTAIAAGREHCLALKSDGTVVGWGSSLLGAATAPPSLSQVVAISAGGYHSVALKANGTTVGWGWNSNGQTVAPGDLGPVIQVAAGGFHNVALRPDGTVRAWGLNGSGQTTVPASLAGVVAVAAGDSHSLALKSNGTVVAWGANDFGQSAVPAGLSQVVAIAAGDSFSLALRADGTVVHWGYNSQHLHADASALTQVISLDGAIYHGVALRALEVNDLVSASNRPLFTSGMAAAASARRSAVEGTNPDPNGWAAYFAGRAYFSDKVGIGTAEPTVHLDVRGDVMVTPAWDWGGLNLMGDGRPVAFVLRDGAAERATWGLAAMNAAYSTDATSGDVVLRTTTTGTKLLIQNGGNGAALVVRNNRLGVGVVNPDTPVSIRRDSANARFGYCISLNDRNGTPWWKIGADDGATFSIGAAGLRDKDLAIYRGSGDVEVGASLHVIGAVYAADYHQMSDRRWKTEVQDLGNPLERVEALRGVSFEWIGSNPDGPRSGGRRLGFIAQEVAEVLPELVRTNETGNLTMNYAGVTPVLVEAVKELRRQTRARLAEKDSEIQALRDRLAENDAERESLRARLTRLESAMGIR